MPVGAQACAGTVVGMAADDDSKETTTVASNHEAVVSAIREHRITDLPEEEFARANDDLDAALRAANLPTS